MVHHHHIIHYHLNQDNIQSNQLPTVNFSAEPPVSTPSAPTPEPVAENESDDIEVINGGRKRKME